MERNALRSPLRWQSVRPSTDSYETSLAIGTPTVRPAISARLHRLWDWHDRGIGHTTPNELAPVNVNASSTHSRQHNHSVNAQHVSRWLKVSLRLYRIVVRASVARLLERRLSCWRIAWTFTLLLIRLPAPLNFRIGVYLMRFTTSPPCVLNPV